jgi:hypothetical protein
MLKIYYRGVYSKNVFVIRGSEIEGYPYLSVPEEISFIASYSYSNPPLETIDGELMMSNKLVKSFEKKIKNILNIALDNGHDSIVLGSFGFFFL